MCRRARRSIAFLLASIACPTLSFVIARPARAVGGSVTVLNGSDPRPFYVVAHNPNTPEEVDYAAAAVVRAVNELRELSPLYEMAQEQKKT